jgi:hypothetical protein
LESLIMPKAALITKRGGHKAERGVVLLGVGLDDAREEMFVMMVCDGLPLRMAFAKAGFTAKNNSAPANLFNLPRVQERARAILDARRTTGVVTLPEVTSMLQRVFAGAHAAEEYSAAHNAAFSLARLYGHVTDRATLEVIRRPSRDPDAPSEQALSAWVQDLPAIDGNGGVLSPFPGPPASLLGTPRDNPAPVPDNLATTHDNPATTHDNPATVAELSSNTNWLGGDGAMVRGRPENGAPSGPVTMTPYGCGPSPLLDVSRETDEGTAPHGKIVPSEARLERAEPAKIPSAARLERAEPAKVPSEIPSFKDLFGE